MIKVKDVMSGRLQQVHPETAIEQAAMEMKNGNIGALPVVENDRVVGMLTDRDITVRIVAEGSDPRKKSVRDIMSQNVQTVYEDADISEVTSLMKNQQIRRVVVLSRDNRPAGIVSLGDLAMSTDEATSGEVLKGIAAEGHKHQ